MANARRNDGRRQGRGPDVAGVKGTRSSQELRRLLEDVVRTVCSLEGRPLRFVVDAVETSGRPPHAIRAWATLHFLPSDAHFCCGEPGCHLGLFGDRLAAVADAMRKRLGLLHDVTVSFDDRIAVVYHDGAEFAVDGAS